MVEIQKELREIISSRPVDADELDTAKSNLTLALPGSWETNGEVMSAINEMVRFGLPDDHWETYPERVNNMSLEDMKSAAGTLIRPDHLVWAVVGDREVIAEGIEQLGYGETRLLDADGRPLQ